MSEAKYASLQIERLAMRLTIGIVFIVMCCWLFNSPAAALDPARSISQYKHTKWTIDDGAPRSISAITQGDSGYLWIGASTGLFRFDGVTFSEIRYPDGRAATGVSTLMVSREGDVWVGFSSGGTAVYRGGVLREVPMSASGYVMHMVQAADGGLWATLGRNRRQLVRYHRGGWADVGTALGFPTEYPIKMIAGRDGTIWATTQESVVYLRRGASRFVRIDVTLQGHASLTEDRAGDIWLSDRAGSRVIAPGGRPSPPDGRIFYPSPTAVRAVSTIFDRDGNLWGMTENGLFRVRTPRANGAGSRADAILAVSGYAAADGLLTNLSTAVFEDREGNIWVGSAVGLERFRAARVVSEPGLTNTAFWFDPLLGASDGSVYIGEADGVYRVRPGGSPEMILRASEPQALCEGDNGAIWIILQDRAVRYFRGGFDSIPAPPHTEKNVSDCVVDHDNRLWIAALSTGLFGRFDGAWRQVLEPTSLGDFQPKILVRSHDQSILVAFEANSLARLNPPASVGRMSLPTETLGPARALFDSGNGLLMGLRSALALIRGERQYTLPVERYPMFRSVAGIVQTEAGQTWMSTSAGIVGMPTAALQAAFADPREVLTPVVLDFRDGLMGVPSRDAVRNAVQGGDGRIWFATTAGIVWIDPQRMPGNALAPPTAISALRANEITYADPTSIRLQPGTSSVQINYSALSLSIPERVRVLYRLEGADSDWVDPGMRRQAFYNNLSPGHYVFHVIAANDDGVWNRVGTRVEFEIPPTFLQSKWFLALCAMALGLLLWAAYQMRIQQLQARMRFTLEERLAERERIARDLHDTLLQGFQGLILRFQSVANAIPTGERSREMIEQALDSADAVLREGRDRVLQLRAAQFSSLSDALTAVAERLRSDDPVEFKLVVEGVPRVLHPVAREEICRIGEEALINAFQHAKAKNIEVAIAYATSGLTLGIRDDGVGIASDIFASGGRQGHFGLTGMRERASEIDASFNIESRAGAGTQIRVFVPGRVAFAETKAGWLQGLFGRKAVSHGRA